MTETPESAASAPRGTGWRIALGAALALAVVLAALVAAFLWGVTIPGEWLRTPLEKALTAAFGMPTRIEGPLRIHTGLVATASADALVLANPLAPAGAPFARATNPSARIDLVALVRREVALEEVTGERLDLELARTPDGRGNWMPIFTASPDGTPSPVAFAGISRLRFGTVQGTYRARGDAEPVRVEIADLDGVLARLEPSTARGTAKFGGHAIGFDLRTASIADLQTSSGPIPVQGTLQWNGAHISLDGTAALDGSAFDAKVDVSADNADAMLAALGIASRDAGSLDARGRLRITGADASLADLALKLGDSAASGSGRVSWGEPRTRIMLDAAAERIDLRPFLEALRPTPGVSPAESAVEALERLATGADADVKLAATEVVGLVTTLGDVRVEGRAADGLLSAQGNGVVSGTRTTATLSFDARKPTRVLSARVEGGKVSSGALPREARQTHVSGTLGSIRGQMSAQGTTPLAVVASARGSIEARDIRWTFADRAKRPIEGRFDLARLSVQGAHAASAELSGRVAGDPCALKVSGGAPMQLFEGAPWPLKLAATCRGARLNASGPIVLGADRFTADLKFDVGAQRIGPIAELLGLAANAPHSASLRGTVAVADNVVKARLDALQLGRTRGSGQFTMPLEGAVTPRVQLSLVNADIDELARLASGERKSPSDMMSRGVLPAQSHVPNLEFQVSADAARVLGETLRRVRASGATRDGRLPPASLAFEWRAAPVEAKVAADFRGARPTIALDGTARNADLGRLLARAGLSGIALRAGTLEIHSSAAGVELGDLLAGATIDATMTQGSLKLAQPLAPGLATRAEFSATLKSAPGQPTTMAARGKSGAEPFELGIDTPGLAGLARGGAPIPATLRVSLGDARLHASGHVARDGTGNARVQLDGERLDRLGSLVGAMLPAVGRYSASANVLVASDAIRASDVDAKWGQSRVLGEVQMRRGGRPAYTATLRSPVLHLEDLGAARWLREAELKELAARSVGASSGEHAAMAQLMVRLRASDIDGTLDVESLRGGSEHFASGSVHATLKAGALHVLLQNARTLSGRVDADVRIDASGAQPSVGVKVQAENLEYGPIARALDSGTRMAGRLDAILDLRAQGPPGNLMPALTGTADFAVYPRDLNAGAIEFWGTGLLRTMLRTVDPGARSEVECAVSGWRIDAGVARSQAFFVDTTNVRILGQLDVDLRTRALSGRLRPRSEHPELITVAPTMVVGGSIGDPRVSVAPASVVLAPLRLATPLAGFALDWLAAKGALATGTAACKEAFDRARSAK